MENTDKKMAEFIQKTPIEDIIRRDDFIKLQKVHEKDRFQWLITLKGEPIKDTHSFKDMFGNKLLSPYYIIFKEIL